MNIDDFLALSDQKMKDAFAIFGIKVVSGLS